MPANTVLDVARLERDIASLSGQPSPLNVQGISRGFGNAGLGTVDAGTGAVARERHSFSKLRWNNSLETGAVFVPECLSWRDSCIRAVYGVQCRRRSRRRLWNRERRYAHLALELSCASAFGRRSDWARWTRNPGGLYLLQIHRRYQHRKRNIRNQHSWRYHSGCPAEPIRHASRTRAVYLRSNALLFAQPGARSAVSEDRFSG